MAAVWGTLRHSWSSDGRWPEEFKKPRYNNLAAVLNPDCSGQLTCLEAARIENPSDPDVLGACLPDESQRSTIEDFCKGVRWHDIADPSPGITAPPNKNAWIYHTTVRGPNDNKVLCPQVENPLSPAGLFTCSANPVSSTPGKKPSDEGHRRLIYVRDLPNNPEFVYSLLLPASRSHADLLGGAICRHLDRKVSFSVRFPRLAPAGGLRVFRLEWDALSYTQVDSLGPGKTLPEGWIDLNFLEGVSGQRCVLRPAHISCGLEGIDPTHYLAYAFASNIDTYEMGEDHDPDGGSEEEEPAEVEEIKDREDPKDAEVMFAIDHLTGNVEFDAKCSFTDPREYFLSLVACRIKRVAQQWKSLGRNLKKCIEKYFRENPLPVDGGASQKAKSLLAWLVRTLVALKKLVNALKDQVTVWQEFQDDGREALSESEDMCSFLGEISHEYKQLKRVLSDISTLESECEVCSQHLKFILNLVRTDAMERGISTGNLTLYVLSPLMLAASIFGMEPSVIPFSPHPTSFLFVLLTLAVFIVALMSLLKLVDFSALASRLFSIVCAPAPERDAKPERNDRSSYATFPTSSSSWRRSARNPVNVLHEARRSSVSSVDITEQDFC